MLHLWLLLVVFSVLSLVLISDLLHLKGIQGMSAEVLSIGGAGVFDGIALCVWAICFVIKLKRGDREKRIGE
jgi:uncharacterized membrane protein